MCNRYRRAITLGEIDVGFTEISDIRIPLRFPEGRPNLQATDICITDTGTIIRADAEGAPELVQRRWSWPGATGKPVFNYRSEGREFPQGRCLIVADGFYEYTTPTAGKGPKDRWLFTKAGEPWFCIAGLWRTHPQVGEAFTMLTTEPGPDVAKYHSRQVALLGKDQWRDWLNPAVPAKELIGPLAAGSLEVAPG